MSNSCSASPRYRAKSGNTGGYGDTVQQLQKVVSGFSNAAETAGLLRRQLQSLQEAKISGILTDEDAAPLQDALDRLDRALRGVPAVDRPRGREGTRFHAPVATIEAALQRRASRSLRDRDPSL